MSESVLPFKMNNLPVPRISIITVVFNGENAIGPTLCSVAEQDYAAHEYLVIDGASRDGTLDLVRAAQAAGTVTAWVSESDAGIYDAMNKGIQRARGDYVYFLNAGDTFHGPQVLSQAVAHLQSNPAVLVGRVAVHGGSAAHYPVRFDTATRADARRLFAAHLCHQALFVRRADLLATGMFSLQYPRFADFHSTWRVMAQGPAVDAPELIVANFGLDGVSSDWRKAVDIYHEKEKMLAELAAGCSSTKWLVGYVRANLYKLKMNFRKGV